MSRLRSPLIAALSALVLHTPSVQADEYTVVASVKPLHSLTSLVMAGNDRAPMLLQDQPISPHHHHLKPTTGQLLENSDVMFWFGPALSPFLEQASESILPKGASVNMLSVPGVDAVSYTGEAEQDMALLDPHVWLDPQRAITMVHYIADVLAGNDDQNADRYRANAQAAADEILALDLKIQQEFEGLTHKPILAFHPAYQYFATRYGINEVHSILNGAEHMPSAKRIRDINALIRKHNIKCILVEPQFSSSLLDALIGDLKTVSADPIGNHIEAGSSHYTTMLMDLANAFLECAD
ncbi:MAG: zinc ABC transporter substrate-binding protein [Gammaproteobacteria bacterium]|nr:zinc ABC transporter substrate-binding protein [Gammaproteobacteria bacterium]